MKHSILTSIFFLLFVAKDALGKKENVNKNNKIDKGKRSDYYEDEEELLYYYYEEDEYYEKRKKDVVAPSDTPTALPTLHPSIFPSLNPSVATLKPVESFEEAYTNPPWQEISQEEPPVLIKVPTSTNDNEVTAEPVDLAGTTVSPSIETPLTSMVKVSLPQLKFRFLNVQKGPNHQYLENSIKDFVSSMLQSQAMHPNYLNLDVTISNERRRRLSETGDVLIATVEGDLYYGSSHPTAKRLTEVMHTYFANWGDADLREHLSLSRDARLEVFLNDFKVEKITMTPQSQTVANKEENMIPTWVLVLGLIIGSLALIIAISLLCWQRRLYRRDEDRAKKAQSDNDLKCVAHDDCESDNSSDISTPHSISGISVDNSIYTSATEIKDETSADNAKRLDKVLHVQTTSPKSQTHDDPQDGMIKSTPVNASMEPSPTSVMKAHEANSLQKFLLESRRGEEAKSPFEKCLEQISMMEMKDNTISKDPNDLENLQLKNIDSPKPYDENNILY